MAGALSTSGRDSQRTQHVAKRSYPTSEVRGSGRECQAVMAQEWPRGATPCTRPGQWFGGARVRVRGREEPLCPRGQGHWPGRSTHIQGAVAALVQEDLEELSHVEGQEGQQ